MVNDFWLKGLNYALHIDETVTVKNVDRTQVLGYIKIPSKIQYQEREYVVTTIAADAFADYQGVSVIEVPHTVAQIGKRAFQNSSLKAFIRQFGVCPYEVSICEYAFANCKNLEEVKLSGETMLLGKGVFEGCHKLHQLDSRNLFGKLPMYSFLDCENLEEISLDSVDVEADAFMGTNLQRVHFYRCIDGFANDFLARIKNAEIHLHGDFEEFADLAYDGFAVIYE